MLAIIFVLALVCALLAYLLIGKDKKNSKLLVENSALNSRLETLKEISDIAVADSKNVVLEDSDARQKPLDIASVRTALRFNGFTPEIPDTNEPNVVLFKEGNTQLRFNAQNLPFVSLEVGFGLDNTKDEALLRQAASEVTSHMYIGKVEIVDNAEAIIFSAEFLCDSYVYLRDNFKQYLGILHSANDRFFEVYNILTEKQKEEREAVFSGRSFVQSSQQNKVQS
jgi:hypothetical protein